MPALQYNVCTVGKHEIHILSLIWNSSQWGPFGVGWVGGGGHLLPPPHCPSHQLWMTIWGWVGGVGVIFLLLLIAHLTNSGWPFGEGWVGGGVIFLLLLIAHLTNSGWPFRGGVGRGWGSSSSSLTHQPNFLQFSSETKLTSITVCQHSLS